MQSSRPDPGRGDSWGRLEGDGAPLLSWGRVHGDMEPLPAPTAGMALTRKKKKWVVYKNPGWGCLSASGMVCVWGGRDGRRDG